MQGPPGLGGCLAAAAALPADGRWYGSLGGQPVLRWPGGGCCRRRLKRVCCRQPRAALPEVGRSGAGVHARLLQGLEHLLGSWRRFPQLVHGVERGQGGRDLRLRGRPLRWARVGAPRPLWRHGTLDRRHGLCAGAHLQGQQRSPHLHHAHRKVLRCAECDGWLPLGGVQGKLHDPVDLPGVQCECRVVGHTDCRGPGHQLAHAALKLLEQSASCERMAVLSAEDLGADGQGRAREAPVHREELLGTTDVEVRQLQDVAAVLLRQVLRSLRVVRILVGRAAFSALLLPTMFRMQ
mmetsp:Transcript_88916/g.278537  ORF Transcript_88916/g.278537 Transcript_88916/m.278537 type:complete len:294 (+) Transcript_88916:153-1034(+)